MEIIVDSNLVIAAERADFDIELWLSLLVKERVAVAAVTVAELWHGVERASARYRKARQQYIEDFVSSVIVHPYTETTAYEHARIWAQLESRGTMIGLHDVIIAATAIERRCAVATFNYRHFSQIDGLTVIDPLIPGR
jgi:tRNA(fMet)-specific endonuclease VapC